MPTAIFFAPLVVPANAGPQTISGFGGMENMPMMVVNADAQVLDALRGAGNIEWPVVDEADQGDPHVNRGTQQAVIEQARQRAHELGV